MNIKFIGLILLYVIISAFTINAAKVKMALLLEGQVDDLGINYEVNQGLAETEAIIKEAAKVVNEVDSYDSTYDAIKTLLSEGYNLIITSSEVQMRAALDIADDNEDTYFLIYGEKGDEKVHSRVGTYYYNLVSPHFVLGYIAGGMGKSVGMVVPGPPVENYYTANAFFSGMKYYTTAASLSVVSTAHYNDLDTAVGAGKILLARDIQIVTQSQTDMTVANMFLNDSRLAFGTNGFPQSNIYGNRILQSVVHNFNVPFLKAANMVINDNWITNFNFFGDFDNDGFLSLDYYSFLIDGALKNQTEDLLTLIRGGAKPYLTDLSQNSLTYEKVLEQKKLYDGIVNLGYYAVPTTEVYSTGGINKAFMAVSILEMAICLVVAIIVVFFFNRNVMIMYSTIPFCITILVGACFIAIAILLWNLRNLNDHICLSKIWMASFGYNILIGFIIIKSSLIYFKFKDMVKNKNEKISPIPFGRVCLWFIPLLIIDCVLLIIYSTSGNPGKIDSLGLDGIGRYEYTQNCVNNLTGDIMLYIILVFHGLQLLYGCVIAWKARIIDLEEFIEAHDFATAIYLISFCSFIIVILMVGVTSISSRNTIISACAIFSSFSCVLIIFGAKFWKIYKPIEDDGLPQIKLKPQKSYSGSTGGAGNTSGGSKSKKTSAHSSAGPDGGAGAKSKAAPQNTDRSAMASINIQNFVNPIEASSRAAPKSDD